MFKAMPKRLFDSDAMDKADRGLLSAQKLGITGRALAEYRRDAADIKTGKLKSPSSDYIFVWNPETGERLLFKGQVDPVE